MALWLCAGLPAGVLLGTPPKHRADHWCAFIRGRRLSAGVLAGYFLMMLFSLKLGWLPRRLRLVAISDHARGCAGRESARPCRAAHSY
jgi:ABC-type dipeptide/oligopeptide/nickel transport system permease component